MPRKPRPLFPPGVVTDLAAAIRSYAGRKEEIEDEPCSTCGEGDKVPAKGYWRCPECDAEWFEEEDALK